MPFDLENSVEVQDQSQAPTRPKFDLDNSEIIDTEVPRQHTYRESTDTVVDAPIGLSSGEIEYYDDAQNYKGSDFMRGVRLGVKSVPENVKGTLDATAYATGIKQGGDLPVIRRRNDPETRLRPRFGGFGRAWSEGQGLEKLSNIIDQAQEVAGQSIGPMLPSLGLGAAGFVAGGAAGGPAGAATGAGVGAFLGSESQIPGEFFLALEDAAAKFNEANPDTPITYNEIAGNAILYGTPAAILDALPTGKATVAVGRKLTEEAIKSSAKEIIQRIAAKTGKTAILEGSTETLQEATKQGAVAQQINEPLLTPERAEAVAEAFPAGAVGGSALGAGGAVIEETIGATQTPEDAAAPAMDEETQAEEGSPEERQQVSLTAQSTPRQGPSPEQMVAEALAAREARKQEVLTSTDTDAAATTDAVNKKMRDARLRSLDRQVDQIDTEIDRLENEIVARREQGRKTQPLENKVDRLLSRRDPLDQERADILTVADQVMAASPSGQTITDTDAANADAARSTVEMKGSQLQTLGKTINRERIRGVEKGLREGQRLARTDTKAAQNAVIAAIEDSGLPLEMRGRFIAAIKNIQTSEQAAKALPRIAARLSTIMTKQRKRDLRSAIRDVLDKAKIRKQSGKPVGKFADADLQRTFDMLREASKLSKEAAVEKIIANLDNPEPTIDTALENQILSMVADIDSIPTDQIEGLLETIKSMSEEGRADKLEKTLERKERIDATKQKIIDTVLKGRGIEEISQVDWQDRLVKMLNSARAMESGINNAWFDTLDIMLGTTPEGQQARDALEDPVFRAIQEEAGLTMESGNGFVQLARNIFGLTSDRALKKKFIEDEQIENLGEFSRSGAIEEIIEDLDEQIVDTSLEIAERSGEGKPVKALENSLERLRAKREDAGAREAPKPTRWEISRAQARKLWMELQDPDVRQTLVDPDGNGISPEMEQALDDFLTAEDKQFAQAQMRFYKEIYPHVDKAYAELYGVHLPDNPNYSPIRRRHKENIGDANEFLTELKQRMSAVPGFTKSRVKSHAKIMPQSDVTAMLTHITQASHFIAMAETSRDLHSVFSDPNVREAIEASWGSAMLENIDGYIMDFTSGQIARAEGWMRALDVLNSNYAKAKLGLKINMIPKQMSSMFAYATEIPLVDYMAGLADFVAHPVEAIRVLSGSDLMKRRGASQDVDIAKGAQQQAKKLYSGKNFLDDVFMLPIKIGDRAAIYTGGWAVYKYNRDVLGKSHEESIKAFEKSTDMMQQSANINQLSRMQAHKNPFMRTLGMFMSAPNAYYRAEKRAIRQMVRGEISVAEAGKKLAIIHLVLPSLFQYIANGFYWDDEDQKRAAILGSLNGFLLLGTLLENTVSNLLGVQRKMGQNVLFAVGFQDLFNAMIKSVENGEIEWKDLVSAVGTLAGVPVETGIDIVEGAQYLEEGYPDVAVKRALGYSESASEKPYE